jgi:hypothetical protein
MAGFVESLPSTARSNQVYDWEAIASKCKTRPETWFHVGDDVIRSRKGMIERGQVPAFRDGHWEVKTVGTEITKTNPARAGFYVRYLGPSNLAE